MKTESEIRQKLKQVLYRHRKNYVQKGLSRLPENCEHNRVVRLPVHTGNRATIRVCGYIGEDGETNDRVCDSTMAGDVQAQECPFFECVKTATELKEEFKSKMGLGDEVVPIGAVAKEYPDVAALKWVMDPGKTDTEAPEEQDLGILALLGAVEQDEDTNVPDRPLVEKGSEDR